MLRNFVTLVGWSAAGCLGIAALAYAVLLIVNLEDEAPSPAVAELLTHSPEYADAEFDGNAWLYLLGLDAPPDRDPLAFGLPKHRWNQSADRHGSFGSPAEFRGIDMRARWSPDIEALSRSCRDDAADCLARLAEEPGLWSAWIGSDLWLLNRYQALIGLSEFRQPVPRDVLFFARPSYFHAMEGQRLHLLEAALASTADDTAPLVAALERDLVFWRTVLADSRINATRFWAGTLIDAHFRIGNDLLRSFPRAAPPRSWRRPLSDAERSFLTPFAGEFRLQDEFYRHGFFRLPPADDGWYDKARSAAGQVLMALLRPLFQPQATSNRMASLMLDVGRAFEVPYSGYAGALERARARFEREPEGRIAFYNPVGGLAFVAPVSLLNHPPEIADLEGIRRAVLAAQLLRVRETPKDDVRNALQSLGINDPYTDIPFAWNEETDSVVFVGLSRGWRGRREFAW